MNDFLKAIIIGIVEGLTEFIPVSSTAHIRITQSLLGIAPDDEFWKMFAIAIQLGAIIAVLVYFAKRLRDFARSFFRPMNSWQERIRHPFALTIISFVVTAVPCFVMDELIGEQLENLYVIGWALLVGGVVMWIVDKFYSESYSTESIEKMSLKQAVIIGAAQILSAAFPGTSRSMSTIAAGQLMGLSRTAALEFSFFLSIPVMLAATSFKFLKFMMHEESGLSLHQFQVLSVGFIVSFLVALVVIAWLMKWVRTGGFIPFAVYRIILAVIVLGWLAKS